MPRSIPGVWADTPASVPAATAHRATDGGLPRQALRTGARAAAAPATPARARLAAQVEGCRPRQAAKNVLVLTAPALSGLVLTEPRVALGTLLAFVAFCCVSSAVYLANDLRDVAADRCHPTKRFRPIARGALARAPR